MNLLPDHFREATDAELTAAREKFGDDWPRIEATLKRTEGVARSRDSGTRRYFRLVEIATDFSAAVAPHVACRGRGCSHCCKMAVNITEREAIRIGEYLNRAPARLPVVMDPDALLAAFESDVQRYTGQPCPMLADDGSCTVYSVRPLACILQHSLEDTPELCNLETGRHWVKKLSTMVVSAVLVAMDINHPMADIREFFP